MNWNKFAGPAILAGFAILIWQGVSLLANIMYDDGDTVNPVLNLAFLGMGLISILMCLSSLVWFAFALGTKTQQKVMLAGEPSNSQNNSDSIVSDSQSMVASSTVGGDSVSYIREKFIIAKSEGDTAQMVGFFIIAASVAMFLLMIILGFIWILSGMGSGLGGSGGTCDESCESWGSAAKFSMWASFLLFPCGVITLARPWTWFSSTGDIRDPVVKVRIGIVSGIALIAVISFGWPALLVIAIALTIFAAAGWASK
ncbi:MAG: hypothetical protein VXY53_06380 [Candidatus Thermoplasmatota archaeon]|nr:hypothetical protein [Candidatus Thermoplasmatota archaeon]